MGSIWHWLIVCILVVPYIYFCKSYKLLLSAIEPKHDGMPGNLAYLLLIPVFNVIWWLILLFNVKNALTKLREETGLAKIVDGGFYFGLGSVISWVLAWCLPAVVSIVMSITCVVLWIVCWRKVVEARKSILA